MVSIELIKRLRAETGLPVKAVERALSGSGGDLEKARAALKVEISSQVSSRSGAEPLEGAVDAYVHDRRIGVLVEVNCETDFVAKNETFRDFVHDLSLQISSMNPKTVAELMGQEFIKDSQKTIADYLAEIKAKFGEEIVIRRFDRYQLGEVFQ